MATRSSRGRSSPWSNPNRYLPSVSHEVQPTLSEQSQNSDKESNCCDFSSFPPLQPPTSNLIKEDAKVEPVSNQTSSSSIPSSNPKLLHLSFNEDHTCFAAGTNQGILSYNCETFAKQDFVQLPGICNIVEMFGSDLFALVGDGSSPHYPPTTVMIWNNSEKKSTETVCCRWEVLAVRLLKDYIIIVLKQNIHIRRYPSLKTLHTFVTIENLNGLCVVSQISNAFMLVCPGLHKGQIRVQDYAKKSTTRYIPAHTSEIACVALARDGKLVATCSTKGTLVRIFNTLDGTLLQEVRRGADRADIYSLVFSTTSQWLAVSSDKCTVHVFALKVDFGMFENDISYLDIVAPVSRSSLSFMKGVLPRYFSSEWSIAQFRLPEHMKYIVGFGEEDNTIIIIGMDGNSYRCRFNPQTRGAMTELQFCNFLSPEKSL